MSDEKDKGQELGKATEHTPNHGIDANDKPGGGALNADNPNDPRETDDKADEAKTGGSGAKTGALGGAEPTEPGGPGARESQKQPHGEAGR